MLMHLGWGVQLAQQWLGQTQAGPDFTLVLSWHKDLGFSHQAWHCTSDRSLWWTFVSENSTMTFVLRGEMPEGLEKFVDCAQSHSQLFACTQKSHICQIETPRKRSWCLKQFFLCNYLDFFLINRATQQQPQWQIGILKTKVTHLLLETMKNNLPLPGGFVTLTCFGSYKLILIMNKVKFCIYLR